MQKKKNPRNPKYYSFTVSRDSFVDLRKLECIDTSARLPPPKKMPISDAFMPATPMHRKCPLDKSFNRLFKRIMDISISLIVIFFVLSWMIPLLVIWKRISAAGPAFFFQKRKTRDGNPFECLLFSKPTQSGRMAIGHQGKINLRKTNWGKWMEVKGFGILPQFFNVLFGDMSIIGPESYPESEAIKYENLLSAYARRYAVKPGLTGLDRFSSPTEDLDMICQMKARTRMDLYYIHHWSPALDGKILLRSIAKLLGLGLNYSPNLSRESV
jgi:putative colanic acid biosysnthesis UDP-glucose lipid carrier transferase